MKRIILFFTIALLSLNGYCQSTNKYSAQGYAKIELEDYRGAILAYNKAIALNTKDAENYAFRGFSKFKLADYKAAIVD